MDFGGTEERDLGTMEKPNHGHENRIWVGILYPDILSGHLQYWFEEAGEVLGIL